MENQKQHPISARIFERLQMVHGEDLELVHEVKSNRNELIMRYALRSGSGRPVVQVVKRQDEVSEGSAFECYLLL